MKIFPTRGALAVSCSRVVLLVAVAGALAACSSQRQRAPVEDKSAGRAGASVGQGGAKVLPGAENAGKPGYYTVKPGDTLARVAVETGQSWRDIARWNNITNPNVLEVGQVLRVARPGADSAATAAAGAAAATGTPGAAGAAGAGVAVTAVGGSPGLESRPLDSKPVPAGAAASAPVTEPPAAPTATGEGDIVWAWPASGAVLAGFDEARTKGLVIAGQQGEPVLAAANGRVVYVGSELRGYGNLVIVKHNESLLSAYAHNQSILVKEGQVVRRGQKIAEMGASDASRVQLHFEVRRGGKPIDPARVLPPR